MFVLSMSDPTNDRGTQYPTLDLERGQLGLVEVGLKKPHAQRIHRSCVEYSKGACAFGYNISTWPPTTLASGSELAIRVASIMRFRREGITPPPPYGTVFHSLVTPLPPRLERGNPFTGSGNYETCSIISLVWIMEQAPRFSDPPLFHNFQEFSVIILRLVAFRPTTRNAITLLSPVMEFLSLVCLLQ